MTFTIITPSLNGGSWLPLCIASVADQGVACEHLVQDAGSTDGTQNWLRTESRVKTVVEPDSGLYDAINRGIRRASGDLVAWLNCDEQYLPGTLARVEQFFAQHPLVEVVFGDIVMVNEAGEYLCHRKVEAPMLHHTWTCHLSTLSCGTFFRRRLVETSGFEFDASYRCGGDGEWMVRLLRAGVHMAALRGFTSVFTQTGRNLGRSAQARTEWARLRATAPLWVRAFSPAWVLGHRVRRWRNGAYRQTPFEFSLYTQASPTQRVRRKVEHPVAGPPG
jgi:glycosyltransferase involved in cell wall biosynthesis